MGAGILFLATIGFMIAAAVSDFRRMIIPNYYTLAVIGFFILGFILSPQLFEKWWWHLLAFGIFFIATYIMFCYGIMGGGDTKFGSALALWVGLKSLMIYMFYMAIVGGILGALTIFLRRRKPVKAPAEGSWIARAQAGENAVPYGIAISAGALMTFLHIGFHGHQIHELFPIIN